MFTISIVLPLHFASKASEQLAHTVSRKKHHKYRSKNFKARIAKKFVQQHTGKLNR